MSNQAQTKKIEKKKTPKEIDEKLSNSLTTYKFRADKTTGNNSA